jgi:hypothetical protein
MFSQFCRFQEILKVCDSDILKQLLNLSSLSIVLFSFLFKTTFPQVKMLLIWAQSIDLAPISGHQNQCKAGYVYQMRHKPPMRIETII